jgi:hypothetical protein
MVEVKIMPQQIGFSYKIKDKFLIKKPSNWLGLAENIISMLSYIMDNYFGIIVGFDETDDPSIVKTNRLGTNFYEHDLFEITEKLATDQSKRISQTLLDKNYWRVQKSGVPANRTSSMFTRALTDRRIKHPLMSIDYDYLSLSGNLTSLRHVGRFDAELRPYFAKIHKVYSYIKNVSSSFALSDIVEDDQDKIVYFPYVAPNFKMVKLFRAAPSFRNYVVEKIDSLVESSCTIEVTGSSEAGTEIDNILGNRAMTASFGNEIPSHINPSGAVNVIKSIYKANLHTSTCIAYHIRDFSNVDIVTVVDLLLLPLLTPSRLINDISLIRGFNYLLVHFFSHLRYTQTTPARVDLITQDNPTKLFSYLQNVKRLTKNTNVKNFVEAAYNYLAAFSDLEGVRSSVLDAPLRNVVSANSVTVNASSLPFYIEEGVRRRSLYEVDPYDSSSVRVPPAIKSLFTTFLSTMQRVQFDSNIKLGTIKSLLSSINHTLIDMDSQSYRMMKEFDPLTLYPLCQVGTAKDPIPDESRHVFYTAKKGDIMSVYYTVVWENSSIHVRDLNFIGEGITDIFAISDVLASYRDSFSLYTLLDQFSKTTYGFDISKRSTGEKFSMAEKLFLHNSTSHAKIHNMFNGLKSEIKLDIIPSRIREIVSKYADLLSDNLKMHGVQDYCVHRPPATQVFQNVQPGVGLSLFTISSIHIPDNVNRDVIDTLADVVPALRSGNVVEFKYPVLHSVGKENGLIPLVRDNTLFSLPVFPVLSDEYRVSTMSELISQLESGVANIYVGWEWIYEHPKDLLVKVKAPMDAITGLDYVTWNAFVRVTLNLPQIIVRDPDQIFFPTVQQKSWEEGKPFRSVEFISINQYAVHPMPTLTIRDT